MKAITHSLILILTFLAFGLSAQDCDWYLKKDLEKGFRISFPLEPEASVQEIATDKGSVDMHSLMYSPKNLDADNLILMHAYTSYPKEFFEDGLVSEDSRQTVLSNSVQGAVSNTNGTLLQEKMITFNGYPGRIVKISIQSGYIIEMHSILVNFQLYLTQVIYPEGKDGNPEAERFFNSFDLIHSQLQ